MPFFLRASAAPRSDWVTRTCSSRWEKSSRWSVEAEAGSRKRRMIVRRVRPCSRRMLTRERLSSTRCERECARSSTLFDWRPGPAGAAGFVSASGDLLAEQAPNGGGA